jgi:curved DNA-binding protein CbpA
MKLDSKYFDSIRVRQDPQEQAVPQQAPVCQWKGCQAAGLHRAPKGRGKEGQYFLLCLDHVREFNASYNYFEGWSNAQIEAFQKDAVIGHRPTWRSGANLASPRTEATRSQAFDRSFGDPHAFFAWRSGKPAGEEPRRRLKPLEIKSLEALDLTASAAKAEIKARFKELVKRHHPDANGGDKRSENKLREIIQAYNYLKQAGLV